MKYLNISVAKINQFAEHLEKTTVLRKVLLCDA